MPTKSMPITMRNSNLFRLPVRGGALRVAREAKVGASTLLASYDRPDRLAQAPESEPAIAMPSQWLKAGAGPAKLRRFHGKA